mgnify:CR=1 FL=1
MVHRRGGEVVFEAVDKRGQFSGLGDDPVLFSQGAGVAFTETCPAWTDQHGRQPRILTKT